jgi:hypothetical protein
VQEFPGCTTLVWGGGHSLSRSVERHVTPTEAERLIRESPDREPGNKKGRWVIKGCVGGRQVKIVVQPMKDGTCLVVTVIRTNKPCS